MVVYAVLKKKATLGRYLKWIVGEVSGSVSLIPNANFLPHWFSSEAFLPFGVKLAGLMHDLTGSLLQHGHIF